MVMEYRICSRADVTRLGRLEAVDTFLRLYIILGCFADTHRIGRRYCWIR